VRWSQIWQTEPVSCSNDCATTESYTIPLLESSYGNIPSCSWPNHSSDVVKWSSRGVLLKMNIVNWWLYRVVDSTFWSPLTTVTMDTDTSSAHHLSLGSNSIIVHHSADSGATVASAKPQSSVLFHTHFTNNTPDVQVWVFLSPQSL